MLRRLRSFIVLRRRWIAALLLLAFLAINALAFLHARAMTHFVMVYDGDGTRIHAQQVAAMAWWRKARMVAVTGFDIPRPVNRVTPAGAGLPFTTHHFHTADGVELEAWHIPHDDSLGESRGVVVVFHGYGGVKSWQIGEAEVFRRLGFDSLLVDFRGGGGSRGDVTTIGYRESLDVAAAVDFARHRLQPDRPPKQFVLYGPSMGAATVLRAIAVDHVQPDAIILECPFDRLLSAVRNRALTVGAPRAAAAPLARLLMFWGGVQQGYWAFAHNPCDYARSVRCPTLLMVGEKDPWVREDETKSIYDNLATEQKRLVTFALAGHEGCRPHEPVKWEREVAGFLADRRTNKRNRGTGCQPVLCSRNTGWQPVPRRIGSLLRRALRRSRVGVAAALVGAGLAGAGGVLWRLLAGLSGIIRVVGRPALPAGQDRVLVVCVEELRRLDRVLLAPPHVVPHVLVRRVAPPAVLLLTQLLGHDGCPPFGLPQTV